MLCGCLSAWAPGAEEPGRVEPEVGTSASSSSRPMPARGRRALVDGADPRVGPRVREQPRAQGRRGRVLSRRHTVSRRPRSPPRTSTGACSASSSTTSAGKRIVVEIGGKQFTLPVTASNGHATTEIELASDLVARIARDGRLEFAAVLPEGRRAALQGNANLVARGGVSVISDIDDTVKVTEVTNRAAMLDRTFFRDFEAAPGMAALYTRWGRAGRDASLRLVEPVASLRAARRVPDGERVSRRRACP